jgi:DNA-binding LacI/PurR family transcriptional regulator
MEKKLNIDRIAKLAGVSTATVSRVINDYPFVKDATRRRVLEVIRSTNYRVNAVARNLRRKKTHSIGVIISNVLSPFYSVIAKAVEDVAMKNQFSTVLCNGGDNPDKELNYLRVLHENRVDGIILSPTGKNLDYLRFLTSSGIPLVCVDRVVGGLGCDSVLINNQSASAQAVSHLLERGYRKIGFISGPIDRTTGAERLEGYTRAFRKRGLPVEPALVRMGDFSYESGREHALDLLERAALDALYVANTDMASGAFRVLKEKNIRIPGDLAYVMFDDPDWTTMVTPPVTAVKQPVYTIGSTAADLLFRRILDTGTYLDKDPVRIVLEATLMARGSA